MSNRSTNYKGITVNVLDKRGPIPISPINFGHTMFVPPIQNSIQSVSIGKALYMFNVGKKGKQKICLFSIHALTCGHFIETHALIQIYNFITNSKRLY